MKDLEESSRIQWLRASSKQPSKRTEKKKKNTQTEQRERQAETISCRALKTTIGGTLDFIL